MNWIKNFIKVSIVISLTLGCLAFIELSVRYFYHNENASDEWLTLNPKAFWNDENYNLILMSLDGTCKWPPMLHKNNITIYSDNFSCGGVTYLDGKRLTLPSISQWKKTIHVFGGSTIMGTGAIDRFTIPSFIQKTLINNQIRVLNYGFPSYVTSQQNNTLESFANDIKEEDIVIYYDGGNDFWNSVMLANFNGSMVGYNQTNKYQIYVFLVRGWLSQNSKTYQLLSDLKHGRKKTTDQCDVDYQAALKRIPKAAKIYSNEINKAKLISESLGAKFFHFYQPTIFDSTNLTTYEEEILSQNPCWITARTFKNSFDNIFLKTSQESIDLSDKLVGKDLFFDYIHTSAEGNKLISEIIVNSIKK